MENLILVNKDDLREIFKEVAKELRPDPDEELLTSAGLASYLGYSIEWVLQGSSKVRRGKEVDFPPIHRRGRKLLFRKAEVDAWIEGGES